MRTAVKPVVYQLVVRYFGNTNTTNQRDGTLAINGCGRFEDINSAALKGIKNLGATHVWLTGCLRQATLTDYASLGMPADNPNVVKGIAGSFYAVRDYFDVSPDYALRPAQRMAEFEAVVERIHEAGMKVLIDFVPNHVARGYHSLMEVADDFGSGDDQSQFFARNNHFFYLVGQRLQLSRTAHWNPPGIVFDGEFPPEDGTAGHTPRATGDNCASASPNKDNWYETIKLNYGYNFVDGSQDFTPRPRTWDLMDQVLAYWQDKGVDGFRCDMAYYVPAAAWRFLIPQAHERDSDCLFLAEAYPGASAPPVPITDLNDLIAVGFDAFYHSDAYNALKRIYQGSGSQNSYDRTITPLSCVQRAARIGYLENHDERRIASPLVTQVTGEEGRQFPAQPGDSGFQSAEAGFQLAPLQFLFGKGPILFYNGQEVGEPGAGWEGYSSNDGRTTTFDYWHMPEFAKWVNGHAYNGGVLTPAQKELRHFYCGLLALCQDPSVLADGYWGLQYHNCPSEFVDCPEELYSFARFESGSGRLLVVAANFRPGSGITGQLRIPPALAAMVNLPEHATVRLVLNRSGAQNSTVAQLSRMLLISDGFSVTLPNQTAQVYIIE